MNKVIKQMCSDSMLDIYSLGTDKAKWDSRLNAFATSIILKCAEIADTAEPYLSSDLIKEHFGVSNLEVGGEHMAGDGGYSIGSKEGYDAFVALRNGVMKKSDAPSGMGKLTGEDNA
jgi:hypothetical protein